MAETPDRSSNERPETGMDRATDLALRRTFLAYERTLMAWIRTATSLITFGFTIYKFFQYLTDLERTRIIDRFLGPREFALGMIGLGIAALVVAALQQRSALKLIEFEYARLYPSLAANLAWLVSFVGVGLFLIVFFQR